MPIDQGGVGSFYLSGSKTANREWLNDQFLLLNKEFQKDPDIISVLANSNDSSFQGGAMTFGFFRLSDEALKDNKFANNAVKKINSVIKDNPNLSGMANLINLNAGFNDESRFGGLRFQIYGSASYDQLENISNSILKDFNKSPEVLPDNISFARQQVYDLSVDRALANQLQVPVSDVFSTLQASYRGTQLTDDYRYGSDTYPIIVQLDRSNLKDFSSLSDIYLKSNDGYLLPLNDFVDTNPGVMRPSLMHFDQQRQVSAYRNISPNHTLGQAVGALKKIADKYLIPGVNLKFAGEAKDLQEGSNELTLIFIMGIIFIYLVLAALFESFIDPLIILLTVPLCIIGALVALYFTGGSLNLYTGIGLLTLIGLVSKHGILITQFVNQKISEGVSRRDSILKGSATRLRPIIMTSLTMVLGALPLLLSEGAGSNSRSQIGWVIVSGVTIGTFFSLFVVPVAYDLLSRRKSSNS